MTTETRVDGRNDFDFLIGSWDSVQHKLKKRLQGCDEWDVFSSHSTIRKTLDGLGNFDEVTMELPTGRVVGVTVRTYEPSTQLWRIYWIASNASGPIGEPMVGRFVNGRGEFYDHEIFDGRAIFSRFIWTSRDVDHCRWEQAFSEDGGKTWETNWTMDFTRSRDA
ncbi:MAG TPA: DUF1579 domain-containing protein [Ktedonobacterales bacterium]